jgi:DNA-binding MarR family transcriptional regulator
MHTGNVLAAWALMVHDALAEAARASGLDGRELAALTLVAEHPGCSVDWLRRRIDLTQSGTVRLVDRLEAEGLIARGTSAGKSVPLRVAAAGLARLDRWQARRDAAVESLLPGLSADERARLVDSLATALRDRPRDRQQADTACRTCTWSACGTSCPVDQSVQTT